MPRIRIRWHTNETYDEEFDCPDEEYNEEDFDLRLWVWDNLMCEIDDFAYQPATYDRDLDYIGLADEEEEYPERI